MKKVRIALRALFDPRTPRAAKWAIVGAVLYGLLPFDLIPDFLPPIGELDDLIVILIAITWFLQQTREVRNRLPARVPPDNRTSGNGLV